LERASRTLRGITEVEVIGQRATVVGGVISEYHATIEVTFWLEGQ
jgi:flavin-binding protein dodecin